MIRVMLEQESDALIVPNPAIADNDQGEKIVRLQQGDAWIDQVVELGIADDANTVILSGLQEGDVIKGLYINDVSMQNAGIGQDSEEYYG